MANTRKYSITDQACADRFRAAEARDIEGTSFEGDGNEGRQPRHPVVYPAELYREESLYVLEY